MALEWTPYHVPLLLSLAFSGAVAALAWRRRETPGATPLVFFAVFGALWTIAELMNVSSTSLGAKLFWTRIEICLSTFVPVAWVFIALEYTGRIDWITRRAIAMLSIEPGVVIAIAWLQSDLLRPGAELVYFEGTPLLAETFGPVLIAHFGYSYLLTGIALVLFVRTLLLSRRVYTFQVIAFVGTVLILLVSNAAYVLGLTPAGLDPTNLAFVFGSGILLVAIRRQQALDVVPAARTIAREELITGIPDAVVVLNRDDRIVDVNPAAEETFDVLANDVIGDPYDAVMPALASLDLDSSDDPPVLTLETDDGRHYYDVRHSTIDQRGPIQGRLLTLRDVTERRRTEERYQTLIDRSRDIIAILDRDGTISYVSPSVESVLGYDIETVLEGSVIEYVHPEDTDEVLDLLGEELPYSGDSQRMEFRFRKADGSWRWLEALARDLTDDPLVNGIVVNARDVTDRKRREQQVTVMRRLLRHNLRNDMNVIRGHVDVLVSLANGPGDQHDRARASASVITSRIDTVIDRSNKLRIVDEFRTEETTTIDVREIVETTVDRRRRAGPDVDLRLEVEDQVRIPGDSSLEVAVDELVENAIEHGGDAGSTVTVTVAREGQEAVIRVSDDGPGIPDAELAPILSRTETPLEHGSGVGLWLVNWVVERFGGNLSFEREDGETTVAIHLPLAKPSTATETATVDEPAE
ncbi:MAG TPA: histidine kinase N-terminal 7TM domain-containing protein [Natrialbaceae archaeon]|nr:histidine kinase N-terminal 7TM domain-containing protein [Natrialbaceae archaeon]